MKTQTYKHTQKDLVKDMRKIRDQISIEIKDMTFEEERVYLDKLLNKSKSASTQFGGVGADEKGTVQQ